MPTVDEVLLDTSAAVALVVEGHDAYDVVRSTVGDRHAGLAGHAVFEVFSVLTRLPAPHRRSSRVVVSLLESAFPATRFLSPDASRRVLGSLAAAHIAGGSVYDALIAATAQEHRLPLATLDRRALPTYRAFNVDLELID